MIIIQLNKQDFEYDLHSLVKSFYPGEDVTVCYEEPENAGEALLKISVIYTRHLERVLYVKPVMSFLYLKMNTVQQEK